MSLANFIHHLIPGIAQKLIRNLNAHPDDLKISYMPFSVGRHRVDSIVVRFGLRYFTRKIFT